MRSSHAEQIKWIESRFKKLDLRGNEVWPKFIEICERRNLLTHTGGIVSQQYLNVCREHNVDIKGVSIGDKLSISTKYYLHAVRTVLEFGLKVTQIIWRKLLPNQIEEASSELNEISYRLIEQRRYKFAASMLKFGLEMPNKGTEATRMRMVVNYANAEKLDGNKDAAEKIIAAEDLTALNDAYRICVAAIQDDIDGVVNMMKSVTDPKLVGAHGFREWPVFESLRSDPKFVQAFEETFREKLFTEKQTVPAPEEASLPEDQTSGDDEVELPLQKRQLH
jgi:hypothetical protein